MRPSVSSRAAPTWKWESGAKALARTAREAEIRVSDNSALQPRQQRLQQPNQSAAHHRARLQHLFVIDLRVRHYSRRHVGHARDAEALHPHVVGHDYFG